MSAIIRTSPSPGGGNAKPHFIKRENYVLRGNFMYTSNASKERHPTAPVTSLCSQPSQSSGLIFYPISLRHSASAPLASLLFLKYARHVPTARPLHVLVSLFGRLFSYRLTSCKSLLKCQLLVEPSYLRLYHTCDKLSVVPANSLPSSFLLAFIWAVDISQAPLQLDMHILEEVMHTTFILLKKK